jgi:hypothetical protein
VRYAVEARKSEAILRLHENNFYDERREKAPSEGFHSQSHFEHFSDDPLPSPLRGSWVHRH